MNYKIVSDSASNLLEMPGAAYACVPLKIVCGEKEYVDVPGLDVAGMVADLKVTKQRSGTSCPNVHEWVEAFAGADAVFAVTITGSLSGSYAAAVQAKEDYIEANPHAQVHVINTLSAGPEMRLIIEKLQELLASGLSFEQTVEAIETYRQNTHLLFCLQCMNNLARNGRVSPAKAKLAGILGIRAIGKASDEGTLQPLHKVRGGEKSVETLFEEMKLGGFSGGRVQIDHCENRAAAEALQARILAGFPQSAVRIGECTALCSYYAEQYGLMIGYEG